jgi:hypothetical protein
MLTPATAPWDGVYCYRWRSKPHLISSTPVTLIPGQHQKIHGAPIFENAK